MQRGRQRARAKNALAAARLQIVVGMMPLNLVLDAEPPVEIDQIGAAAEQHMLAVIDFLARGGDFVGGSASAEEGPGFEKVDFEAGFAESSSARHPGEAAANNFHAGQVFKLAGFRWV